MLQNIVNKQSLPPAFVNGSMVTPILKEEKKGLYSLNIKIRRSWYFPDYMAKDYKNSKEFLESKMLEEFTLSLTNRNSIIYGLRLFITIHWRKSNTKPKIMLTLISSRPLDSHQIRLLNGKLDRCYRQFRNMHRQ